MRTSENDIAIIGMSGRFPGARDLDELWRNLRDGVESITFFAPGELAAAGVPREEPDRPGYVPARPVLADIELFDASFFGFTPREAEITDPQQRLSLECVWEALEAAGYDPRNVPGRVGVFAGARLNTYLLRHLVPNPAVIAAAGELSVLTGNDKDYLATRISYELDLKGPSLTVQTACSTSLVAVHLACESLLGGESDLAVAGGVSIEVPQVRGYLYQEGGIASPDGHCRAFDARAAGTVFGSGLGVVVLKRLEDALRDGDTIRAVIKGSAVNNDGSRKIGYTAPGEEGQAQVIAEALEVSGVDPETIGYVEAHGTGTPMGDPIEIAALTRAFRASTDRRGFCAIGSIKSNLGHLDTAAGIAGLIKTVLALEHRQIPPSLHFESPNPRIRFEETPFLVNARLADWPARGGPRRAGVSSFGIGGTNVHLILEEAPAPERRAAERPACLLLLSARTRGALDRAAGRLADFLEAHPEADLHDVAHTLQEGRHPFEHRWMAVCRGPAEALAALCGTDPSRVAVGERRPGYRPVAFLFSGQGSQYDGMGSELYQTEPSFRATVDRCCEILRPILGTGLRRGLTSRPGEAGDGKLRDTSLAQPALFVLEYALARLLESWGIQADALLGHSIGEYVAACLAGVFSLGDALRLVAERGRLMQELPPGAMLAVPLAEADLLPHLVPHGERLSLAAVNGPERCVVSGPAEDVAELQARLEAEGIACQPLHTSHAFHSAMMEPALEPFVALVRQAGPRPPQRRWVSNLTGTWITAAEATDPGYWARHLRHTVRFGDGLATLLAEPDRILLEIGPGRALSGLAARHPGRAAEQVALPTLPHPRDTASDWEALLGAVGRLWLAGVPVDWRRFAEPGRRRIPLPTYPFERKRFWVDPPSAGPRERAAAAERNPIDRSFYLPLWKQAMPPVPLDALPYEQGTCWILLGGPEEIAAGLAARLATAGHRAFRATDGLAELLDGLQSQGLRPAHILHLEGLAGPHDPAAAAEQGRGLLYSLVSLAQLLGSRSGLDALRLTVVAHRMERLGGDESSIPEKALLLGPCRVIPQEYPGVRCRAIDLALPQGGAARERCLDRLLAEAASGEDEPLVAWRGEDRWVRRYEPLRLDGSAGARRLRERPVVLITGGLGALGLEIAGFLAEQRARLVLIGRTPLPDRAEWEDGLAAADGQGRLGRLLRRLLALEAKGAEVVAEAVDVTDCAGMRRLVARCRERFGVIHGIVHAAGVPGGGLIQLATAERMDAVLAPKLTGARVLAEVLDGWPLDFFVLFSSTIALTGGVGQVEYAAANAFLDAFARDHAARTGIPTISVNWPGWREVGMAAEAASPAGLDALLASSPPEPVGGPLLERRVSVGLDRVVYATELRADRSWVLGEHRILGTPVLPGTAFLEMVAAAALDHTGTPAVEIRNAHFLAPLAVPEGEGRTAWVVLETTGEGFGFRILTGPDPEGGSTAPWREHARGEIAFLEREPEQLSLAAWETEVGATPESPNGGAKEPGRGLVSWGPRWNSLREVKLGRSSALARLELPSEAVGDLESFVLHPALLDVAVSFAARALARGTYLPMSYERVAVHGPLPARIHALARWSGDPGDGATTLSFDVVLADDEGRELATVTGFTMRRIEGDAHPSAALVPGAAAAAATDDRLATAEGVEAFARILASCRSSQIVVSVRDLGSLLRGGIPSPHLAEAARPADRSGGYSRPDLASPYQAPQTEAERRLAEVWSRVLGIERVGLDDNFFELGGDSLLALQVVAGANQAGLRLTPGDLFRDPTVRALAAAAGRDGSGEDRAASGAPPAAAASAGEGFELAQVDAGELDSILTQLGAES